VAVVAATVRRRAGAGVRRCHRWSAAQVAARVHPRENRGPPRMRRVAIRVRCPAPLRSPVPPVCDANRAPNHDRVRAPNHDRVRAPNHDRVRAPNHDRVRAPNHDRVRAPNRNRNSARNRDRVRVPSPGPGARHPSPVAGPTHPRRVPPSLSPIRSRPGGRGPAPRSPSIRGSSRCRRPTGRPDRLGRRHPSPPTAVMRRRPGARGA
jgi:hypothetical protein